MIASQAVLQVHPKIASFSSIGFHQLQPHTSIVLHYRSTTLYLRILVLDLPLRKFHSRPQPCIQIHSSNLMQNKTSVLWKNHARIYHRERARTVIHVRCPPLFTLERSSITQLTLFCISQTARLNLPHPKQQPKHARVPSSGLPASSLSSLTHRCSGFPISLLVLVTQHAFSTTSNSYKRAQYGRTRSYAAFSANSDSCGTSPKHKYTTKEETQAWNLTYHSLPFL